MRGLKILAIVFWASLARAQDASWKTACFYGLNNAESPALIGDCEAQDALNVEANLTGTALLKRDGFNQEAALTYTTAPVTGRHRYRDSSGNNITVVCHDRHCAKSTNGGAFSNFLSTAGGTGAVPTRWSFVDLNGNLYGGNDKQDPILKYDGTTLTYPAGFPKGSILSLTQDRMIIGDISGTLNRVSYSSAGAVENWTTGANDEDPFFDDLGPPGERITGLSYHRGFLYVYKSDSITSCELGNQYTTRCSIVVPNLGTNDPASIVVAGNDQYFRGNDGAYWSLGPNGLEQISRKISGLVSSSASGSNRSNTQTTKTDWDAGSQSPASSWNTTTTNGSIFPSSVTFLDTSSTNFVAGTLTNLDATSTIGTLQLSSNTGTDNFTDGNYTSNFVWTVTGGTFDVIDGYLRGTGGGSVSCPEIDGDRNIINTTEVAITSGSWTYDYRFSNANNNCESCAGTGNERYCSQFGFMKNAGNSYYAVQVVQPTAFSTNRTVRLVKNIAGTQTILTSDTSLTMNSGEFKTFRVVASTYNAYFLHIDNVFYSSFTDTDITSSTRIEWKVASVSGGNNFLNHIDNVVFLQYTTSGTILSRIFDTAFTTPTAGTFSSTFTALAGEGNIWFRTRASTSPNNDLWTSFAATSDTLRPTNLDGGRRYWQYEANLYTYISTKSPTATDIVIVAATTGTFRTQCISPGSSISSWGILACSETTTGGASLVYKTTSAATCATLPDTLPNSWQQTTTNNSVIGVSTDVAMYVGFRSLLTSATEQAQVDACIINWVEGTPAQPTWAAWDSLKNSIYWTNTSSTSSKADRLLKYDINLGGWFPFGLNAVAPVVYGGSLYFGGSSSGTWNRYGVADSDNGVAINAYWTTRDIGAAQPFLEKDFKSVSILSRNQGSGSATATWTLSNGKTDDYTISLSTTSGLNYARSNFKLPISSPQNFMNLKLGNFAANQPFEVLGIQVDYFVRPWIVSGP